MLILNVRERIPKGQSHMDNQEKLSTYGKQDEKKQSKNTTWYVLDTAMRYLYANIYK